VFLQRFEIDTVIDVGANAGQYGEWLRTLGYKGRIFSVEPNPAAFDRLKARAAQDQAWSCYQFGAGERDERVTLGISELDCFSSLLKPTSYLEALDARASVQTECEVQVRRLDDLLEDEELGTKILIKVDTQGYEKAVLAGASRLLVRAIGVQLELSLTPLYVGQPPFEEMIGLVRRAGFSPYALWEVGTDPETGAVLEMDGLFFRS
jgi:FkbM family methyltransferase